MMAKMRIMSTNHVSASSTATDDEPAGPVMIFRVCLFCVVSSLVYRFGFWDGDQNLNLNSLKPLEL